MLLVNNADNAAQVIRYTALGTNVFEACTALVPGAGSAAAGSVVTPATFDSAVDTLLYYSRESY